MFSIAYNLAYYNIANQYFLNKFLNIFRFSSFSLLSLQKYARFTSFRQIISDLSHLELLFMLK